MTALSGYPTDHELHSLRQLESLILLQLQMERRFTASNAASPSRTPDSPAPANLQRLVLRGKITDMRRTVDPSVLCSDIEQDNLHKLRIYINLDRRQCTCVNLPND